MTIKIAILGHGRMGKILEQCINEADDLILSGIWSRDCDTSGNNKHSVLSGDLSSVLSSAQVAIDFTLPEVTEYVIRTAANAETPLVCGVSGISAEIVDLMVATSKEIPILYDRNMSIGIAVLQQMVNLAGATLGDEFEAEIHETHHIHKIDAPSGTALQLGERLAVSRKQSFTEVYHYDPCGTSKSGKGQIHFEVSRRGEVPGEHTVVLKGADESLSLTHEVGDRRVFAVGAIRAARWLIAQTPGFYSMQNLIQIPTED